MGCPNKTFVKLNDLVEDVELAERLKEQRRRNRNWVLVQNTCLSAFHKKELDGH